MILRRLTLHLFAAGNGRSIQFVPGLNVVLGPNEAGKTTLSSALKRVLFSGGPMTQARFRAEIQPFLPVGIGDTARVSLEFVSAGTTYLLERTWTAPKNTVSRMRLAGGGELNDEGEIQHIIEKSLGAALGTYDHVLSVSQSKLTDTINQLAQDADGAAGGFADVLRKSLYESDGIAIDRFKSRLENEISDHYGRWDRVANAPEKGRGLEAPWEKGAGTIVKAYYEYLRAKRAFEEADQYEHKIDEFVGKEKFLAARYDALARRVAEFAPLAADARRRAELAVKLRECGRDVRELREVLDLWPKAEAELTVISEAIDALLARHKSLTAELTEANERTRTLGLRELHARVESLHGRVIEEEQRLSQLPPMTEKQRGALEKEHAALQKLEIKISARKLGVRITAKTVVDFLLKNGPTESGLHLAGGEQFTTTVSGRFSISHRDWNLDVWNPEESAEALEQSYAAAVDRMNTLLKATGARTYEEAMSMWQTVAAQTERVKESRVALATVLGEESYEHLRKRIQELPPVTNGRNEADIHAELRKVAEEGGQRREKQRVLTNSCDQWTKTYGSRSEALTRFSLRTAEEQRLREAIDQCQPLPQGYHDAEAFLNAYDKAQRDLHDAERALTDVEKARLEFEKNKPERSREELEEEVAIGQAGFDKAVRHGKAYLKIQGELERLLQVLDGGLFDSYHRRVRELLAGLTLRRHEAILMQGPLPDRVGTLGRQLMVSQLSVGTVDVLAVAIRLAMAEIHLPPGDGFIILDDPLVNLDPERQTAAADCFKQFAAGHQVIVLTCHPAHAKLLGGSLLTLTGGDRPDIQESL